MKHIALIASAIALGTQENPAPLIDLTSAVVQHRLRGPATASVSGNAVAYPGRVQPPPPLTLELISLRKPPSGKRCVAGIVGGQTTFTGGTLEDYEEIES